MKIVFTIGDCNGIGLEVLAKGLNKINNKNLIKKTKFYIIGHKQTIAEYYKKINYNIAVTENFLIINNIKINIINTNNYSKVEFGKETLEAGLLAIESIELAVKMLQKNKFNAMVTLPISKAVVKKAGWKFQGHTEMLAARFNVEKPLMILCSQNIRVALLTIHIPISLITGLINQKSIQETVTIFNNSLLKDFKISKPKIAILGLNPHAGENGIIGNEEKEIFIPVIKKINKKGINLHGPFPADGFFAHNEYLNYDGILAIYHDQGLIPLKLLAQGQGVNFTANLPIVRTSPDHGTAFSIAGKNLADGKSLAEAIKTAITISTNRFSNQNLHN